MTEKKKKIAPPAMPTEQPSSVEASASPIKAGSTSPTAEQVSSNQTGTWTESKMEPPKPLSMKERLERVEQALAQADQNFQVIDGTLKSLQPLVQLSQQLAAQQQNPQAGQPQMQGGGIVGQLLQALMQVVSSGGGGTDSELAQLGKDALKSQIAMSTAITNAIVTKITGGAVAQVAEAVAT